MRSCCPILQRSASRSSCSGCVFGSLRWMIAAFGKRSAICFSAFFAAPLPEYRTNVSCFPARSVCASTVLIGQDRRPFHTGEEHEVVDVVAGFEEEAADGGVGDLVLGEDDGAHAHCNRKAVPCVRFLRRIRRKGSAGRMPSAVSFWVRPCARRTRARSAFRQQRRRFPRENNRSAV